MKNKMKWMTAVCLAALVTGFTGCNDDQNEYNGNLDLNLLNLTQAREVWDGAECNITNSLAYNEDQEAKNLSYKLNISLYQDKTAQQDASVKLVVDKDTLVKAIAMAGQGGVYDKYANAELLPEEFYLLANDKITLRSGEQKSEKVSLLVYSEKLIAATQAQTGEVKKNKVYVLPLKIKDSSSYGINDKTDAMMFIFNVTYVDLEIDPETLADTKGVPDDHTLSDGMKLLWHDEFNGTGTPDTKIWKFETGFQRNEEDQWYQEGNASMGEGALVFEGRKERVKNPNYQAGNSDWKKNREYAEYTSSSIRANDKYVFKYGRVLVRAKIPVSQGAWPAIWSTGNWWQWPLGGEIDILEFYKEKIHANVCWGSNTAWSGTWNSKNKLISEFYAKDKKWATKYHIWRMDWDSEYIRLYLDDELMNETDLSKTVNPNDNGTGQGGKQNPYSNDYEGFGQAMWLNLAIGGINGRPIDDSAFPLKYYVDYVRVYQNK